MTFQTGDQIPFDRFRQALAVAHGIQGIGVDEFKHIALVVFAIQVGYYNLQGFHRYRFILPHWGVAICNALL
jgi:hypothetical protein